MPVLLHLDSSADLATSRSRAITATFAEEWRSQGEDFTVTYRDLHVDPLPRLADASLHWAKHLRAEGANPPADAEALQAEIIAELFTADVLLIGAPMYNYSVPASLKAWIDYIHVPGTTTQTDAPRQPLAGRPAVFVTSRGASYDAGSPTEGWDHAIPVLELILGTSLEMSTSVITTNLTLAGVVPALADQLSRSEGELAAAHMSARATAHQLAQSFR